MQIISKVEINYFRSAYSLSLKNCKDINVLMGGNDAGKSNLLKALNLFFNNEANLGEPYSFFQDITKIRLKEVAEVKGRASIWIKVSFKNVFGWKSLPETITIKRSWNRYNPRPETTFSPQTYNGKRILDSTITKFLNKIAFYYVPAVKSRRIFSHYLSKVYDSLIDDAQTDFSDSTQQLQERIENAVEDMTLEIRKKLKFDSTIDIPDDFRSVFEALDFSTEFGEFNIALQNRGDGIQTRHLPFILSFIAKKSKRHHIWAYEEPENSLELSKAFELADQFENDFSKENQIFITTHSPAFYDLSGERVAKWHVKPIEHDNTSNLVTVAQPIKETNELDEELGIAELIKEKAKELYEEVEEVKKLKSTLAHLERPVILTEGKTDVPILTTAWEKLYPNDEIPFEIRSCAINFNGDAGGDVLKKYIETVLPDERSIKIAVFDNDKAGQDCYNRLSHFNEPAADHIRHSNGRAYALLLPNNLSGDPNEYWTMNNLSIELLFKKEYLTEQYIEEFYSIWKQPVPANDARALLEQGDLIRNYLTYTVKVISDRKTEFSEEIVPDLPEAAFENFSPLFQTILQLIN